MNYKRIASLFLVLALALVSTGAFATSNDDTAAKIAEYEAKIADLEAQVADLQHQLDIQNYVVSFDGGYVTVEDALARYSYVEYMYQSYGYSLDGYEDQVKQDIMTSMAKDAVVKYKADELGIDTPDDAKAAELLQAATDDFNQYIDYYRQNFEADGKTDDEVVADTTAYLSDNGLTLDTLYQDQLESFAKDQLYAYVADPITVTDEEVSAEYDKLLAADQASYEGNAYAYESADASGTDIYWNPEGYRKVKQVLIVFSDDQASRYSDITSRISGFESELAALDATPAPDATAAAEATDTTEPTATPRTAELINADLDAAKAELEALYQELMPTAQDVVDLFHAGTGIDELISIYGGDPGMTNEPTATNGYVVSADSAYWDPAFTQAAMSIQNVGEISEPARGTNGLYIVYYLGDVTPGAADFETVKDQVKATLLDTKQSDAYDAQLDTWMEELNVTYYPDNFK